MRLELVATLGAAALLVIAVTAAATCPDAVAEASVRERTRRAQLVFRGRVIQRSAEDAARTPTDPQAPITFWVEAVYKGAGRLSVAVGGAEDALDVNDKLVNVSGWGLCPPMTQRPLVVFALWDFPEGDEESLGELHAEAPAALWTEVTEAAAWAGAGWEPWGEWSGCSASCGGGHQERHRRCAASGTPSGGPKEDGCAADGYAAQRRRCNLFACAGAATPLSTGSRNVAGHGHGEGQSGGRAGGGAYLWVPSAQLFPGGLPRDLALMFTLRLHPPSARETATATRGAVLSIRARRRRQAFLSLEIGARALRLVHSPGGDHAARSTDMALDAVEVPAPLGDGRWHRIAIGLQGSAVHSFVDCVWVSTDVLRRGALDTPVDADVVVGYLFQGELAELTIVPSPEAAAQLCDSHAEPLRLAPPTTHAQHAPPRAQYSTKHDPLRTAPTTQRPQPKHREEPPTHAQQMVVDNYDEGDDNEGNDDEESDEMEEEERSEEQRNIPSHAATTTTGNDAAGEGGEEDDEEEEAEEEEEEMEGEGRQRLQRACQCLHGGVCVGGKSGACRCPAGWTGRKCEHALCGGGSVACLHGGQCTRAGGHCACGKGWSGTRCERPVCREPCRFGGRCVAPDVCACPPFSSGVYCETFTCEPACVNGGACVGPGQCECPHNASGRACERPVCDPPCAAGGVCTRGNRCVCAPGARGPRCETSRNRFRRSSMLSVWAVLNGEEDKRALRTSSSSTAARDDGGGAG